MAARVKRGSSVVGGEVLEGVDGEIDAAVGEGFFDLLDEDSGAVGGRPSGGGDEGGVLHAVACGADDFDFDRVAVRAELRGDVVGLPERELRAARADADGLSAHMVGYARHRRRMLGMQRLRESMCAGCFGSDGGGGSERDGHGGGCGKHGSGLFGSEVEIEDDVLDFHLAALEVFERCELDSGSAFELAAADDGVVARDPGVFPGELGSWCDAVVGAVGDGAEDSTWCRRRSVRRPGRGCRPWCRT